MRWRKGNKRRRAKAEQRSTRPLPMVTVHYGPTWADRGAPMEVIRQEVHELAERMLRSVTEARPIVTTCPICRRPNPCPLHVFGAQMDHYRSRGQ